MVSDKNYTPIELFQFQQDSITQIERWGGRALLALEMGLGKTAIAIRWTALHPHKKPVIIVCPASLKINWQRELTKWLPEHKSYIIDGTKPIPIEEFKDYYLIINYDILEKWRPKLIELKAPILILDECAYIKNKDAKRSKATIALAMRTPHVIAISGTPVINRPVEFYNILAVLRPNMFGSWWKYIRRYCNPTKVKYGWGRGTRTILDVSGADNLEELHLKLSRTTMLRRLKSEVQKELPDKLRTVIPLAINNHSDYKKALLERDLNPLQYFNNLKRVATRGKMHLVIDWIADTIENTKLIAFCCHHEIVDMLMAKFGKTAVKLTGKENLIQRQKAVDEFQTNPKIKLFVGNIQAAGIGLTLTAADHVAFVELDWTPSAHDQAEDRAHRIGQKNTVNVYYLVADGTVEEDILTLIDKKRTIITKIMDGKIPETEEILKELIKLYRERR